MPERIVFGKRTKKDYNAIKTERGRTMGDDKMPEVDKKPLTGKILKMFVGDKEIKIQGRWDFSTENKIPWEDPFSKKECDLAVDLLVLLADPNPDGYIFVSHLVNQIESGAYYE